MVKFNIITIFPNFFESFKKEALIARAQKKNLIKIEAHNLRKWTNDKHKTARPTERHQSFGRVDDRPFGGGAGMVLKVEPIYKAVQAISGKLKAVGKRKSLKHKAYGLKQRIILFSAKGKKFDQATARRWAKYDQLIMICGRYEGIDERVTEYIADEEISIGDYVLFGGEVPAMVVMEAITRLIPGAVAKEESIKNESFSEGSNLEHPQYTRPEEFRPKALSLKRKAVWKVPKVLLSGNHKEVAAWRESKSNWRASPGGREEWRKKNSKSA